MIWHKSPYILWNQVGLDWEEILLVDERDEIKMFIISGRTGAAIWSRIDGKTSVEHIKKEMVDHCLISDKDASKLLNRFLADLEQYNLIQKASPPEDMEGKTEAPPVSWPNPLSSPVLSPFHLEEFVSQDLVALGSYQGGLNNSSSSPLSCYSGNGGVNDVGGQVPCRPGPGYGLINAGYINTPCS